MHVECGFAQGNAQPVDLIGAHSDTAFGTGIAVRGVERHCSAAEAHTGPDPR